MAITEELFSMNEYIEEAEDINNMTCLQDLLVSESGVLAAVVASPPLSSLLLSTESGPVP